MTQDVMQELTATGAEDLAMPAHCPSHDMMQQFFHATVDRLSDEIKNLAEALTSQSKANGESLNKVLANQADRRELCGAQNARLDNVERLLTLMNSEMWTAINELREKHADLKVKVYQYIGLGTGIGLVVSLIGQLIVKSLFH